MSAIVCALDCVAFGVPFRLCGESGELVERMLAAAPLGTQLAATREDACEFAVLRGEGEGFRVVGGDGASEKHAGLDAALEALQRELMLHVANHAPNRVFVHAGVVAVEGGAMLLPGASFAGKTTLIAELVRAGATYYSDEYAVLDERGWVHPYARDLAMRSSGEAEQTAMAVSELRGEAGAEAVPVRWVVFTEYAEGESWRPESVSAGAAALEMMRHAIPLQRTPARVMATLAKVMGTATAVRSMRGEASGTAQKLLLWMQERPPACASKGVSS